MWKEFHQTKQQLNKVATIEEQIMPRTTKNDWLNDLLASIQGMAVSDHLSFSRRIDLLESEKVSVRFIANRREAFAYILVIQADVQQWDRVKTTLVKSQDFLNVAEALRKVFKYKIPVLLYDDNYIDKFSVSSNLRSFVDVNDVGLYTYFSKLNNRMTRDPGDVQKRINESINDSFQEWTRGYLSKYVTVNDFDALLFETPLSQHPKIFELKRVQEDVTTWEPYVDDQANYAASLQICRTINADFRTISYQVNRTDLVGLHIITYADRDKVEGRMITCHPNEILRPPASAVSHTYRSTRRRQAR